MRVRPSLVRARCVLMAHAGGRLLLRAWPFSPRLTAAELSACWLRGASSPTHCKVRSPPPTELPLAAMVSNGKTLPKLSVQKQKEKDEQKAGPSSPQSPPLATLDGRHTGSVGSCAVWRLGRLMERQWHRRTALHAKFHCRGSLNCVTGWHSKPFRNLSNSSGMTPIK